MAEIDKSIYIGTVSYLLSLRSYQDFIKTGLNVNQLPLLSDAISQLQWSLEQLQPIDLRHQGGSAAYAKNAPKYLRQYASIEPFNFRIHSFYVESVSFESGSVYAKIKIGALCVFTAYHGLADYHDVKDGFSELRADVMQIVNNAFGVDGAGPIDIPQNNENAEIRYYFTQPKRIEEEILRRRVEPEGEA